MATVACDLGVDDVHAPSAGGTKKVTMSKLNAAERRRIPASGFAAPGGKLPIEDKAHADNAAARINQTKGLTPAEKKTAASRIRGAQSRFGEAKNKKPRKRVRMTIDGGRIEVHHLMNDASVGDFHGESFELRDDVITASDSNGGPVWIQVAKPGHFYKVQSGKAFRFEMNNKVFSDVVRNFEATQNKSIPVDFEHASEASPATPGIAKEGAPAQGWIKALKTEGGCLYARVEWGDKARGMILAKEYRYVSPAIRFDCKDRTSGTPIGAVMTSVALTNIPFLDGMQPIAAKDAQSLDAVQMGGYAHSSNEYMPRIRQALRLDDLAMPDEMKAKLCKLEDLHSLGMGNTDATIHGVKLADHLPHMRETMGAKMGSTYEELFDLMHDMIDEAMDEHELEYHGGEADDGDEPEAVQNSVALSAHDEGRIEMATVAELEAQLAAKTLELQAAKAEAAEAQKEVTALLSWKDERENTDLNAEVDVAFLTYKDKHGLTEDQKPHLLAMLKTAPESFRNLYKQVDPAKRHLQQMVAPVRPQLARTLPGGNFVGNNTVTMRANSGPVTSKSGMPAVIVLADKIQADNAKMDRTEALNRAVRQIQLGYAQ